MAAIVGAFTKHMQSVKTSDAPTTSLPTTTATVIQPASISTITPGAAASSLPTAGEYEMFCRHMQKTTKLTENGKFLEMLLLLLQ